MLYNGIFGCHGNIYYVILINAFVQGTYYRSNQSMCSDRTIRIIYFGYWYWDGDCILCMKQILGGGKSGS